MKQATIRHAAAVAFGAALLAAPATAQYREYYVLGKVLDAQKAPVAGVEVRLLDAATSRTYQARTDAKGVYRVAGLPHGVYTVTFSRDGYTSFQDEWKLEAAQSTMKRIDVPEVVLASQSQAQQAERLKEAGAAVKKASEMIRSGDLDGATALLQDVLAKNPADVNALFYLGLSHAGKQRYKEAVEALTRVTELQPGFPGAWLELGICYGKLGDVERALDAYEKSLRLDPANTAALYNSGLLLFEANRIEEALARFEQGIALKPADPDLLDMAARCYINQGKFDRAAESLEKARAATTDPTRAALLDELLVKVKAQIR